MASEALLTADLGNSACKLRVSASSRATRDAEFSVSPGFSSDVLAWLDGLELDAAFVSSVAAAAREDELCEALESFCARGVVRNPESGLRVECADPGAVGADRLFAARGALEELRTSLIVADAGTALTVDAVIAEEGAGPRFLGGAIAPGPSLGVRALATRAARLSEVELEPRPPALGRDTASAIRSGVAWGFLGAARELVQRVSEAASLPEAPLVVTGGARAFLLPELPERAYGRPVHVVEEAVLLGLLRSGIEELERTGASGRESPWKP